MGLSTGYYFGLTPEQVKSLRAEKGDPPRRRFIEALKQSHDKGWMLKLGDAWSFLQHLFDPETHPDIPAGIYLCHGRSLHKGEFFNIEILPFEHVVVLADALNRVDKPGFRRLFSNTSEERFRYRYVPFWVAEEWKREGRTKVFTQERRNSLWSAVENLRRFLAAARDEGRHVVFTCNFKDAPY